MLIAVKNRVVKHNLELLKVLLRRVKAEKYKAWIDISTGEIRTKRSSKDTQKKNWKAINIHLVTSQHPSRTSLVIDEDTKTSEQIFDFTGWTMGARRVMLETVLAVNTRLEEVPSGKKSEDFLERFASAQITLLRRDREKKGLIREAWHTCDREEAEAALHGCDKGTYLFRKDNYTVLLEQELHNRFDGTIDYCVTLTYLDEGGIVRDKTLVQKDEYLVIFNDNPNLLEPHFLSIEEAMQSIDPYLFSSLKPLRKKSE